jgi:hypothetical protein
MIFRKAGLSDIDVLAQLRVDMLCEETDYPEKLKTLILRIQRNSFSMGLKTASIPLGLLRKTVTLLQWDVLFSIYFHLTTGVQTALQHT